MEYKTNLIKAQFLRRTSRFSATVNVSGEEIEVHVPNSGRLRELFRPGQNTYLQYIESTTRKTKHDLVLVEMGNTLCSCDSRLPPLLIEESFNKGELDPFLGFTKLQREVSLGNSRIDILISSTGINCYIEAKSVTLVEGRTAIFPDAPTLRGTKHINSLLSAVEMGYRAAVVFIIQRADAQHLSINRQSDPLFFQTLRAAKFNGVEVYAFTSDVSLRGVTIQSPIPVNI